MPAVLTSTTPGLALPSLAAWCHALDALRRWIFTVVSTGSILLIAWLVLRPRR